MPGQIAGEMALLADKPHTQDARAVEETLLWFLPRNDFSALTTVIPEPVSYTHLRAHETVLDLVCRLLLEKKNT